MELCNLVVDWYVCHGIINGDVGLSRRHIGGGGRVKEGLICEGKVPNQIGEGLVVVVRAMASGVASLGRWQR